MVRVQKEVYKKEREWIGEGKEKEETEQVGGADGGWFWSLTGKMTISTLKSILRF